MNKKQMKNNYKEFWERDKDMSLIFLSEMGLQKENTLFVDEWFLNYLKYHSESNSLEEIRHANELRQQYQLFPKQKRQMGQYFLGKLIKYYNISCTGWLKSLLMAQLVVLLRDLIIECIDKRKVEYSPLEFVALTKYLQCSEISPNGNLIENILKIESKNKIYRKATVNERSNITTNILAINSNKGFHHDIRDYKKILRLIEERDENLINYIYEYKVINRQGCYQILKTIFDFRLFANKWEDFTIKIKIIDCFDSSTGATPKERWKTQIEHIKTKIGCEKLNSLCAEIVKQEELKNYPFEIGHWSDDVVKRFVKGAKWASYM
ncbi:hypothetical protein [Bacteroides sp. 224]|uniref:hypothetical protein n=1 Tax=Bacteroides sp. 224 TaxID=2302936 RepID=UPI0013D13B92|nr:hypothetical protein [Bacteroides sp. 224]NDV66708.1 hypothetical protein [Bacteroides sp. 224]